MSLRPVGIRPPAPRPPFESAHVAQTPGPSAASKTHSAPAVIRIPEKPLKPTLVGIGFGTRVGLDTVVDIFGEKAVRNGLPKSLKNLPLPDLSGHGVAVAGFLAALPDALSDPGRLARTGGLFVSFTLPGSKTSWVAAMSPGQQSLQVGQGRSFPVLGGEGMILTNVYGGGKNLAPGGKEATAVRLRVCEPFVGRAPDLGSRPAT